jgi:hypothetical protein
MKIDLRNNQILRFENGKLKTHKPLSTEFKEIEILLNGKILVIEGYYSFKYENHSNLYCLNRNLEIDWYLPFPDDGPNEFDYYVAFSSQDDKIFANSWGGFRVKIDTQNGTIIETIFTK